MFFSQTVRRDDEGAERDVIARALGAGRDSFDQRRMPTEGSEDDDPLRWLGPGEFPSFLKLPERSVRERKAIYWQANIPHPSPFFLRGSDRRRHHACLAVLPQGGKGGGHDLGPAVVVSVVPVAADCVPPSAHVRLKGCCTF